MSGPAAALSSLNQLYETYNWNTYPDLAMLQQPEARRMMFPDTTAVPQLAVEYGEIDYYSYGTLGVMVCSSDSDGYVSMIHYSADGFSRIIHHQLPVFAQQEVTLSGRLPVNIDGATLLLFWKQRPDMSALAGLARTPNAIDRPITGVSESHWHRRGSPAMYIDPWRDPFRPVKVLPVHYNAAWPWCSARMTSQGKVVAKDCAVDFSGPTGWSMDEYGTFGTWRLDWGSELAITAEMPASENWQSVELLIQCGDSAAQEMLELSVLELTINGWPVTPHFMPKIDVLNAQPVAISLSQYVHAGSNRIILGVSSLASREWPIDGIEIWVY
jgi:hypothetical protein